MEPLLSFLRESISDEVFSRTEKRDFKSLVAESNLDSNQINFLRSQIYELANAHANDKNYKFILEWLKTANNALLSTPKGTSDVYFTPGEACRNAIIQQIESATTQLHICVFTISDDSIANRLILAHQKGVDVKIITDNDKSTDEGSDVRQLARAGITIKMDATPNHMHHKFMVADQQLVITGSYNWTRSAFRYNHENILLTREAAVIRSYSKEFQQLWSLMHDYK
ncbi:MAG: phospholipase D-like domain-containing protein [Cyclobacteriaceae bacterium]